MEGIRLPNVTRRAFHLWGIPSENSRPPSRHGVTQTNQHQVKIHPTGYMASTAQDFQDRLRRRGTKKLFLKIFLKIHTNNVIPSLSSSDFLTSQHSLGQSVKSLLMLSSKGTS